MSTRPAVLGSRTHLGQAKEAMGSDKVGWRGCEKDLMGYKRERAALKKNILTPPDKPR